MLEWGAIAFSRQATYSQKKILCEEVKVTVTILPEWEGLNRVVKNGQPLKGKVQFSRLVVSDSL